MEVVIYEKGRRLERWRPHIEQVERGEVMEGGETQEGIKKKLITFSQTTVMPVFLEQILRKTKRSPIKCNQRDKENRVIT